MRLPVMSPTAAFAAVLGVFVLAADSPATAQNRDPVQRKSSHLIERRPDSARV